MISESDSEDEKHANNDSHQTPKWVQSTLQAVGDLVGDLMDPRRTRSQFEEAPHALTTTK
jgi:hypothetical protein